MFALFSWARKIVKQLNQSNCKAFKVSGIWISHYTMSLWENEEEMKRFARSGAHLDAMKASKEIANEIITSTLDADQLPSWKEAKKLLEKGKVIRY